MCVIAVMWPLPLEGRRLALLSWPPARLKRLLVDAPTVGAVSGMDLRRMFFVVLRRIGPHWDLSRPIEEQSDWPAHASFMNGLVDAGFIILGGPLADEERTAHVVEAESEDAVRATLARDPWSETHLRVDTIDAWTIRLDGRST